MTQDTQNTDLTEGAGAVEPNQPDPRRVRTLLIVVIVLGILLVGGLAVVVGTIIKRLNDPEAAVEAKSKRSFGDIQTLVPAGSRIVGMQTTADKLVVQLSGPGGESLVIYDVRKGVELGRIKLLARD
ncbi:MAG: hypothetical protein ACON4W_01675 [Parvibaculales bacterium]